MSSRTRSARAATRGAPRTRRSRRPVEDDDAIPEVYREMLAEAEARDSGPSDNDRPSKRFKPAGYRPTANNASVAERNTQDAGEEGESSTRKPQTVYNSPSESDESDMEWEEVDIHQPAAPGPASSLAAADDAPLQITLGQHADQKRKIVRRKPITAAERKIRLDVHKTHLLCLLCHVQKRNLWCNDEEVQDFLKRTLSKHVRSQLNPPEDKAQHTRSAMFLDGLNQAGDIFFKRFKTTNPGLRRAHWAHDIESLKRKTEGIMAETEVFLSREDFRKQAKAMQGSRDFGAQLFCALLRALAVEARLVCSLQPLPFSGSTRDIPVKPEPQTIVISSDDPDSMTDGQARSDASPKPTSIRRIGRPNFKPTRVQSSPAARPVTPARESSYPVFWVEAFNEAFQKWIVVDPMVTKTLAKPHRLEPGLADPYNMLSYVVAFEEDASARDVTRRYTKAFNAKVRKNRVESTKGGEAWWDRVLRHFEKPFLEDRDELEIAELTAKTASEPMPRNVQDFKDHPIYALERHLRRNEIIFPKRVTGHVSIGKSGAKSQASEPIYRRSDVHTLRSANKWYRLGRDIKVGEQPLKRIPAKNKTTNFEDEDDVGEETTLYAFFQTELYTPPPVVQGRIPKNAYGNLDVYVPSMVPPGGVHISHLDAAHAARVLGIDYADAVTGFNFKGRHGTAVFNGIVIATEYQEALQEVLNCLEEDKLQSQLEQKSAEALRAWKHFLLKLRIAERVKGYAVEGEADDEASTGIERSEEPEDMGGGFLPDSGEETAQPTSTAENHEHMHDDGDDDMGGGFLPDSDTEMTSPAGPGADSQNISRPLSNEDEPGGGFISDKKAPSPLVTALQPRRKSEHSKYTLVVVPNSSSGKTTAPTSTAQAPHQPQSYDSPRDLGVSADAPITVESSVNSAAASVEPPITVGSSVNDSASASVEILSRAPSQVQSRTQSVEVLSQDSEEDTGSLLLEDPEDEDAVPEWLMSD
ncbi:hypothetical protein BJY04DRAFT_224996 [Aspergillus karnatakaensis]|uniref:putative DNA repair protein Rad4 n=1 Tax=Aspergillus karnatakaensis TaxID=1810916 RepID=UPI003CCD8840